MTTNKVLGTPEIAELLGISRQRVYQLIESYPNFPKPAAILTMGRIWYQADIVEWDKERLS